MVNKGLGPPFKILGSPSELVTLLFIKFSGQILTRANSCVPLSLMDPMGASFKELGMAHALTGG